MARLHEHQGKAILKEAGIEAPEGIVVDDADHARRAANRLGGSVVLKVQAWTTGRAAKGGVRFADSPDEAALDAEEMFDASFGAFPVDQILVERTIDIVDEVFVSYAIDDAAQAPVLLLDCSGGSGIEERADTVARLAVDVHDGPSTGDIRAVLQSSPVDPSLHDVVVDAIVAAFRVAKKKDARSLEINPLVTTSDGRVMAADCRMTIDDYAVFRHPELGIEIARELDHPPTELEKIAYRVEEADHRGTFYFAQLNVGGERHEGTAARRHDAREERGTTDAFLIGFHGAGGGGSMMSMDAVTNLPGTNLPGTNRPEANLPGTDLPGTDLPGADLPGADLPGADLPGAGFTLANFCDTSGNPSASKVYMAARIILAQPGLVGYFGSGSGVASQEQYWSAYGLAKAFLELNLSIPAVIRLGGNSEDRAVEILEDACRDLPGKVEGYRKDDTPQFCAERFGKLVRASLSGGDRSPSPAGIEDRGAGPSTHTRSIPAFVNDPNAYSFPIAPGGGGRVWIDHVACADDPAAARLAIEHSFGLLKLNDAGVPVLAVSEEDAADKDSELIACEIECHRAGKPIVFVDLPIAGLDDGARSGEGRGP